MRVIGGILFLVLLVAGGTRYKLPDWYVSREHPVHYDDSLEDPVKARFYQREVYRHALNLMEQHPEWSTIVDVGAGAGYKLIEILGHYNTIGIETEPALSSLQARYPDRTWISGGTKPDKGFDEEAILARLHDVQIDVVICSDVVEHFADPDVLIRFLALIPCKLLIISTPDRAVLRTMPAYGEPAWLGPPANLSHYREWTLSEFTAYLLESGFVVESSHSGVDQIECQWHVLLPQRLILSATAKINEYHMLGVPLAEARE